MSLWLHRLVGGGYQHPSCCFYCAKVFALGFSSDKPTVIIEFFFLLSPLPLTLSFLPPLPTSPHSLPFLFRVTPPPLTLFLSYFASRRGTAYDLARGRQPWHAWHLAGGSAPRRMLSSSAKPLLAWSKCAVSSRRPTSSRTCWPCSCCTGCSSSRCSRSVCKRLASSCPLRARWRRESDCLSIHFVQCATTCCCLVLLVGYVLCE